jgi:hypothetical protein
MKITQDAKDKSIIYIEGIIRLPISIIHNAEGRERIRRNRSPRTPLELDYEPEESPLRRVCVGAAKFTQTNHTLWSSHQPSGKYLAFNVEWPETPRGANYFEGFSILVSVTDDVHARDMVLVSTEDGFRILVRERGGKFTDAVERSPVNRSSFIPIGTVYQMSGWLTPDQR